MYVAEIGMPAFRGTLGSLFQVRACVDETEGVGWGQVHVPLIPKKTL